MSAKSGNSLATVLIVAAIVAALYFGREVLLPMALAVLLSFVLAPPVKLLQRLYLPRFAAVTIVVLLAFGVIFGLATLMFTQVSQLAGDLPRYQSNLGEKIQTLRGAATASGTLEQASQVLQNLQKELDRPKSAKPTSPTTPAAAKLSTKPPPTGSIVPANTIGTVRVTACNAATVGLAVAKMTSGVNVTNSAANLRSSAASPAVQRTSIRTF
jgi:predicted PurR-regulated permease PerM